MQSIGAIVAVIFLGLFAVFIDIRLTLIEIRDNSLGLPKEQNASAAPLATKADQADSSDIKREPTLSKNSDKRDDLNWQNTDQLDAIAKDTACNSLRDFVNANQSIFEAKGVTTKVVHGGKSWIVDLSGSKGTKSFNQSQLQSLIEWVDRD